MKKLYTIIAALTFTLLSQNSNAIVINDSIGVGGANTFSPFAISANVGDVIHFILISGNHNVVDFTAYTNPAGTFNSGAMTVGSTYDFTLTASGTYLWMCGIHGTSMYGGAVVSGTGAGIAEPNVNLLTSFYPNPFTDKATLASNGIDKVVFYNMIGESVKSMELAAVESKQEIDFTNLPTGTYFYSTYRKGILIETRKIVKQK